MVKNRLILVILSLFTCATSIGATPIATTTFVDTVLIEPLHQDGRNSEISFNVGTTKTSPLTVTIKLINDYYPDGVVILKKIYTKNSTEIFLYDNSYTRPSNTISITWGVKSTTGTTISHEVDCSKASAVRLNAEEFEYKSNSKCLYYTRLRGWTTLVEDITFSNFGDLYVADYYHKLDLSDFYLVDNSKFAHAITVGDILLEIQNVNGAFSNMTVTNNSLRVPLKLEKNTTRYYLTPKEILYVNPITLDMSSVKKDGYVQTNKIYFPRNGKRFENEYSCRIGITKFGIDGSQFVTSFKYKSLRNIIGDCRNSEYCVINS